MKSQVIMPDGNVHITPLDDLNHQESISCWCEPEIVDDLTHEGGVLVIQHMEIQ